MPLLVFMQQALMQAHYSVAVQEVAEESVTQYLGETVKLVRLEKSRDTPLVGNQAFFFLTLVFVFVFCDSLCLFPEFPANTLKYLHIFIVCILAHVPFCISPHTCHMLFLFSVTPALANRAQQCVTTWIVWW